MRYKCERCFVFREQMKMPFPLATFRGHAKASVFRRDSRVRVQGEVVVQLDYSGMVQLLVDSVFPARMSAGRETNGRVTNHKAVTKNKPSVQAKKTHNTLSPWLLGTPSLYLVYQAR